MNEDLLSKILDYIDRNINEQISIDKIANTFYFNRFYIMRIFKKQFDMSIIEYINKKRILNSLEPLIKTDEKILKIALNNGFNSAEYYSEQFSKIIGLNPQTVRKLLKNESSSLKKEYGTKYSENIIKLYEGINNLEELSTLERRFKWKK